MDFNVENIGNETSIECYLDDDSNRTPHANQILLKLSIHDTINACDLNERGLPKSMVTSLDRAAMAAVLCHEVLQLLCKFHFKFERQTLSHKFDYSNGDNKIILFEN